MNSSNINSSHQSTVPTPMDISPKKQDGSSSVEPMNISPAKVTQSTPRTESSASTQKTRNLLEGLDPKKS